MLYSYEELPIIEFLVAVEDSINFQIDFDSKAVIKKTPISPILCSI